MSCVDEIVPIALDTIRTLLRLPPGDLLEEVKVPVRAATNQGTSMSYAIKKRICYGLGLRYDDKTHFRSRAKQVAAILAQHYSLTPLVQGAGPVFETDEETAGIRFLGRLIDAVIGGAEKPPALTKAIKRTCAIFEAQLAAGEVSVRWIYPLPGLVLAGPLHLSESVKLQEMSDRQLETLQGYAEGGLVSHMILLQTTAVLSIRSVVRVPHALTGRENSEILHQIVLSFVLSDLSPPALLTSWPEPEEQSTFEVGHASQFALWAASPLAFFRTLTLSAEQMKTIKSVYRAINSCPAEILNSLPVRRAISAASRKSYEDRLIDLWIALEALLLRNDETSEMQYRMAFRAAWIVKPPSFREFERAFKKSYEIARK